MQKPKNQVIGFRLTADELKRLHAEVAADSECQNSSDYVRKLLRIQVRDGSGSTLDRLQNHERRIGNLESALDELLADKRRVIVVAGEHE